MILYIYEVIDKVAETKSRKEKIQILKDNESWALKDVLKGTYDDGIKWLLPEGDPPYRPALPENHAANLHKLHKEFRWFVDGGPGTKLPPHKRESQFLGILEGVHPADALLLIKMKDKESLGNGITPKLVEAAFPGLLDAR